MGPPGDLLQIGIDHVNLYGSKQQWGDLERCLRRPQPHHFSTRAWGQGRQAGEAEPQPSYKKKSLSLCIC